MSEADSIARDAQAATADLPGTWAEFEVASEAFADRLDELMDRMGSDAVPLAEAAARLLGAFDAHRAALGAYADVFERAALLKGR